MATLREYLGVAARWGAFERARNQSVLRVYALQGHLVRVDTTTAAASVTPDGLFHLGHSKEPRPDLPQGQVSRSGRDPLGWPLTTTGMAGNTADAPLYRPEVATVRQITGRTGLRYVGDCKMAPMGTRAESVAHQDDMEVPMESYGGLVP